MPDRGRIAAIVLAAGISRRFGSDKLLHPLTLHCMTLPLAAHSLSPWLEMFARVTVVVRPDSSDLRHRIENVLGTAKTSTIDWVACPDASQGMASSLACGVRANHAAAGWLIGLADMPALPPAAIAGVRDALASGAALSAPFRGNRRGHPVGFTSAYLEELLALRGDTGARRLLECDATRIQPVEIDHDGIFADIDSPADLHHL